MYHRVSGSWKCLCCCFKHCRSVRILCHIPRGTHNYCFHTCKDCQWLYFRWPLLLVEAVLINFGPCVLANPVSFRDANRGSSLAASIKHNAIPALLRAILKTFIPCSLACPLSLVLQVISLIMMILQCAGGLKQKSLMVMCPVQCAFLAQVINWPHLTMILCLAFKPSIHQHQLLLVFLIPGDPCVDLSISCTMITRATYIYVVQSWICCWSRLFVLPTLEGVDLSFGWWCQLST